MKIISKKIENNSKIIQKKFKVIKRNKISFNM